MINAPNVDAIQEFTLQRGNYDAGYGRSGGGQVLVATKSGTSAFHGDAYEFVRNTIFDANEWFNKRTQAENNEPNKNPINHHNVYGFTIGGPIFIPRSYNADKKKTFFFWSEEWRKLSTPGGDSMPAASPAELAGILGGDFTNAPAALRKLRKSCMTPGRFLPTVTAQTPRSISPTSSANTRPTTSPAKTTASL